MSRLDDQIRATDWFQHAAQQIRMATGCKEVSTAIVIDTLFGAEWARRAKERRRHSMGADSPSDGSPPDSTDSERRGTTP